MDFINKITGSKDEKDENTPEDGQQKSNTGIMDKLNSMAGGGKESEKSEDALDKGT